MFRFSTAEFTYDLPEDASTYPIIRVDFGQKNECLLSKQLCPDGRTDTGIGADGKTVIVFLTQEETGLFSAGFAKTQIKAYTEDAEAPYSDEYRFIVKGVINEGILPEEVDGE